jgi:hypothetical protein
VEFFPLFSKALVLIGDKPARSNEGFYCAHHSVFGSLEGDVFSCSFNKYDLTLQLKYFKCGFIQIVWGIAGKKNCVPQGLQSILWGWGQRPISNPPLNLNAFDIYYLSPRLLYVSSGSFRSGGSEFNLLASMRHFDRTEVIGAIFPSSHTCTAMRALTCPGFRGPSREIDIYFPILEI